MHHHYRPLLITPLLLGLLLFWNGATAMELAVQRKQFLLAEKALARNDSSQYQKLKPQLEAYPLYPYLELRELTRQMRQLQGRQVKAFLDKYPHTPLATQLRRQWLNELGRRKDWNNYLLFYRPTSSSKRQCLYLQALLQLGKKEQALAAVAPLWLNGRSQPKACDPVFDAWRKAGKLTPQLVWQRIELAMGAQQTRLVRYLKKRLPATERTWVERWLRVHRSPETILQQPAFESPHPYRQKILLHGLRRLARKDPDKAIAAWSRLQKHYDFDEDQRYQAERSIALQMINHDHPDTLQHLTDTVPRADDERLLEERIRFALRQRAWPQVLRWIEHLPISLGSQERWRYWRARALQALGREQEARRLYQSLATERSFYGFLAADQLGVPYNLQHIPLQTAESLLDELASRPGIQRSSELFILGRLTQARREWNDELRDMNKAQLQAAAKLAQRWGWHSQAIFTLARTRYWDDLELRFPLLHREQIEKAAGLHQLDDAWVFAVIRQESAFAHDARSPAGALGLMQLMPRTARYTARHIKQPPPRNRNLLQPETNIRLGTAYLRHVLSRLNDNTVLATSAYNAGPHQVGKWLPEQETPADLWVETIPYHETRRYTQRIFTYAVIYQQRLGKKSSRLQQLMSPIPPRELVTASGAKKGGSGPAG